MGGGGGEGTPYGWGGRQNLKVLKRTVIRNLLLLVSYNSHVTKIVEHSVRLLQSDK